MLAASSNQFCAAIAGIKRHPMTWRALSISPYRLGRPAAVERCVLHMDVLSLDLNQCVR